MARLATRTNPLTSSSQRAWIWKVDLVPAARIGLPWPSPSCAREASRARREGSRCVDWEKVALSGLPLALVLLLPTFPRKRHSGVRTIITLLLAASSFLARVIFALLGDVGWDQGISSTDPGRSLILGSEARPWQRRADTNIPIPK